MNSQQTERIHRFLDGEMPAEEAAEFEAWLESHPRARQEFESLQSLRDSLKSADPETPNLDAQWQDFQNKLHKRSQLQSDKLIRFPLIRAVAALLVLGLALWFVYTGTNSPDGLAQTPESDLPIVVELVESDFEESSPIVYLDDESGWIVIWVEETEWVEPLG